MILSKIREKNIKNRIQIIQMIYLYILFLMKLFCGLSLYLYNYQKSVRAHIKQNDDMYEMILEMYKRV